MKAVIVDINGKDAAALCDDGRFKKIKNNNYVIGQELTIQPQMIRFPKQAAIAASAAVAIAACGGMGTYTWSNPISYVSLDINPSIAYSLNEFDRVIAVDGMNDEGAAIVDAIGGSLKNTDISTALTITVEQLSTEAYIDADNTNYMVIGVYSDKDSKADALMSTVDEFTANSVDTCSITTVNVSKETKESADSYGITGGKMELINEIAKVASDPQEVDPVALADLSVAALEQTKNVAASGASVAEAVAAAAPAENEPAAANAPVDPSTAASDSKPAEEMASETSTTKDETEGEGSSPEGNSSNMPAVSAASDSASDTKGGQVSGSAANTSDSSATGTENGSTDQSGNNSSEKKDEAVTSSPSKDETSSSEEKGNSESSDNKGASSPDKEESSSSNEKEEVTEDSSQQTNSGPAAENPDTDATEIPDVNTMDIQDEPVKMIVCITAI